MRDPCEVVKDLRAAMELSAENVSLSLAPIPEEFWLCHV